jgi:hypothetical protein
VFSLGTCQDGNEQAQKPALQAWLLWLGRAYGGTADVLATDIVSYASEAAPENCAGHKVKNSMGQSVAMIAPMGVVDAAVHTLKSRMIGHRGFSIGELISFAAPSLDTASSARFRSPESGNSRREFY